MRRATSRALSLAACAVLALIALLCLAVRADGNDSPDNVRVLTADNFDEVINNSVSALVEFYAPWCGHCKKLEPVYKQLADAFTHAGKDLIIAKIDADQHSAVKKRFDIEGFPTLKWFPKGATENPERYNGRRELSDLISFVESKSGIKAKIKEPKSASLVLTSSNFDKIVLDDNKDVLVEFYAPWCGYCKALKPIYNKVAAAFANEPNCVVAVMDADAESAAAIREKYNVDAFPTLKFFAKDNKENPIEYEGGREEEDFIEFLNERCGTHRTPGGGLLETAGRIAVLDSIAQKFSNATNKESRNALYNQAKELSEGWVKGILEPVQRAANVAVDAASQASEYASEKAERAKDSAHNTKEKISERIQHGEDAVEDAVTSATDNVKQAVNAARVKYAQYYVKVMEKMNEQEDYVEKELARLRKIASSGSVTPKALDDFLTRQNILSAFRRATGGASEAEDPAAPARHEEL